MSEPKRYTDLQVWEALHFAGSTNGWIRWDDYARLKAENERLSEIVQTAHADLFSENARLKAEVERLDTLCKQLGKQHSDISCENIMLRKAGDDVVADLEHLTKSGWFNKCKSVKTWLAAKDGKLLK